MNSLIRATLLAVALAACSPHQPTQADPTGGGSMSDAGGVVDRFTHDIWPAVESYRHVGQGGPESKRFWSIVEPASANAVHAAGIDLGVIMGPDRVAVSFPEGTLLLAHTAVTAINATEATIVACYTYTAVPRNDPTSTGVPAASEATFVLHKTDAWYLHSITDDHVVPGCGSVDS